MADKPAAGAYVESQCLKVAELTVRAEELRARLATMLAADLPNDKDTVKSLAALVNGVTRFESTTRRAAADLGQVTHVESDPVADLKNYLASKKDSSDDDNN
jgi:hypothetical protein